MERRPARRRLRGPALALVAAGAAVLAAGTRAAAEGEPPAPLRVTVTLHPLALLVREVGGEGIDVQVLVPPGASPHTFEPRPSDVARLADAALFVRAGGGSDDWAARLHEAAPAVPALVLAEALAARMPEVPAAHAWLDPVAVRGALAPALAEALGRADPARADALARRLGALQRRLTALDAELRGILADAPGRRFVAFHGAWDAFAARYDLEAVGLVEPAPGHEPSARAVATLVGTARREGVPAILVEPQLPGRVAEVIAGEFGGRTVEVDPLGDPSDPARNAYADLMRFNAHRFREALGGGSPPHAEGTHGR